MIRIAILAGSTRPGRHDQAVAPWVYSGVKKTDSRHGQSVHELLDQVIARSGALKPLRETTA